MSLLCEPFFLFVTTVFSELERERERMVRGGRHSRKIGGRSTCTLVLFMLFMLSVVFLVLLALGIVSLPLNDNAQDGLSNEAGSSSSTEEIVDMVNLQRFYFLHLFILRLFFCFLEFVFWIYVIPFLLKLSFVFFLHHWLCVRFSDVGRCFLLVSSLSLSLSL